MKKIPLLLFVLFMSINVFADDFPLRKKYRDVKAISTSTLYMEFGNVTIIDVRSAFEYNIISIKRSENILISNRNFTQHLNKIVKDKHAKVVFYCNGVTCAKSYKACVVAARGGYKNVFVYDAGILEWAKTYPDKAILLGKSPIESNAHISRSEFEEHLLEKDVFKKRAWSADAYLIDVRDGFQRMQTPDFAKSARKIPFDRLASLLDVEEFMKKIEGKTLYIMDAVGKQIRWLQYPLKAKGVKYYFLKNGVWAYYGSAGASKNGQ